jgi:RimJ/RimL family protein N-acetyltransferase
MRNNAKWASLAFSTQRLTVSDVASCLRTEASKAALLSSIVELFSPSVIQSLPPYFHDIDSIEAADDWLTKMVSESHLFTVCLNDSESVMGFVFINDSGEDSAHLGYLLAERCWHQGYGYELLQGIVERCRSKQLVGNLIGGVDEGNTASAKLLQKAGFVADVEDDNGITFYHCTLSSSA